MIGYRATRCPRPTCARGRSRALRRAAAAHPIGAGGPYPLAARWRREGLRSGRPSGGLKSGFHVDIGVVYFFRPLVYISTVSVQTRVFGTGSGLFQKTTLCESLSWFWGVLRAWGAPAARPGGSRGLQCPPLGVSV